MTDSFLGFINSIKHEIEEKDEKAEQIASKGLNEAKECTRCEAEMTAGSKICPKCGYMHESVKKEK